MLQLLTDKWSLTAAALQIIPARIKLVTIAGAYIVTMNPATTTLSAASKNKFPAKRKCCRYVDRYYQVQRCRYVPQYYTETCCKEPSTMKLTSAKHAKDGFANNNANTYLNTIKNISAAKMAALFLAHSVNDL